MFSYQRNSVSPTLLFFICFLSACVLTPLFGEDISGKIIKIQNVDYVIDGNTSIDALNKELKWDYESYFSTSYDLDSYLQKKRQQLVNKKVFKSVLTSYHITKVEELIIYVDVVVKIESSWTILPLPFYLYDDNLGLVLGFNFEYQNMAGTLTNLFINSYYSQYKSEVTTEWTDIRIGIILFNVWYNQLWEIVRTADSVGDVNLKYKYLQSEMSVSVKMEIIRGLLYSICPKIRAPYSYIFYSNNTGLENDSFKGASFIPAYNHLLEWNSVNWFGSFRQGINATLENQIEYDYKKDKMIFWVDGIFKSFIYSPVVSLNTRVSAFHYYNDFRRNAGERLRGILDYKMAGEQGFFINQNFPFMLLSIPKAGDMQLSPFFDMGIVYGKSDIQGLKGLQYTTGCSLIFFPEYFTSFSVSINAGFNLQDMKESEIGFSSHLYF